MPIVLCQRWERADSSYGQWPDGYSLHSSERDRELFILEQKQNHSCKSIPYGEPYLVSIGSSESLLLNNSDHGIKRLGKAPPRN